MPDSPKYKLNKEDMLKVAKGAGIAAGGAFFAFLLEILPQIDFGEVAYIAIPMISILINAALKFFKNNKK
jgi:hypothetical protein